MSAAVPYPPLALAGRVGTLEGTPDPYAFYDALGRAARDGIEAALPADWRWEGKRILDFGCGAGRTLRHWLLEAERAQFSGCDIDAESVAWLRANLCPPLRVFTNAPEPPLEQPDGSFDLIYAVSVFTHLTDSWSAWLLELHRLLAPDGLLLVTYMGPGIGPWVSGEPWDEERTGMFLFRAGQSWDVGGPMVMHSAWWIAEHWGRAFEVRHIAPDGFSRVGEGLSQGIVVLRRREAGLTPADLERIDPDEPREAPALARNLAYAQREVIELRAALAHEQTVSAGLERERGRLYEAHRSVISSHSWRLTEPLRRLGVAARRRAAGR